MGVGVGERSKYFVTRSMFKNADGLKTNKLSWSCHYYHYNYYYYHCYSCFAAFVECHNYHLFTRQPPAAAQTHQQQPLHRPCHPRPFSFLCDLQTGCRLRPHPTHQQQSRQRSRGSSLETGIPANQRLSCFTRSASSLLGQPTCF